MTYITWRTKRGENGEAGWRAGPRTCSTLFWDTYKTSLSAAQPANRRIAMEKIQYAPLPQSLERWDVHAPQCDLVGVASRQAAYPRKNGGFQFPINPGLSRGDRGCGVPRVVQYHHRPHAQGGRDACSCEKLRSLAHRTTTACPIKSNYSQALVTHRAGIIY